MMFTQAESPNRVQLQVRTEETINKEMFIKKKPT